MKCTHREAVQSDGVMGRHAHAAHSWVCNVQDLDGADLSLSKELAKSSQKTKIPFNFH